MLAKTLLRRGCALHGRHQTFLTMAPGGRANMLGSGSPLKRKFTAMPLTRKSSGLGQPPPTPENTAPVRRLRRSIVPKRISNDTANTIAVDGALATSDINLFLRESPLEEGCMQEPAAARKQATIAVAEQLQQPANPEHAATAAAQATLTSKTTCTLEGTPKKPPKSKTVPRKKSRALSAVAKAVAAVAVSAAAAEQPALPALTPETMPAALEHLRIADPGAPSGSPRILL